MQGLKWTIAALGLLALFAPTSARAQGIGVIPDGVFLGVTPTVSADRRYVRLSVDTSFNTLNGFSTFPVPAAVTGGGGVGFGAGPGGGLFGPGAAGGPTGPVDYNVGSSSFGTSYARFLDTPEPTPVLARPRPARAKALRPARRTPSRVSGARTEPNRG